MLNISPLRPSRIDPTLRRINRRQKFYDDLGSVIESRLKDVIAATTPPIELPPGLDLPLQAGLSLEYTEYLFDQLKDVLDRIAPVYDRVTRESVVDTINDKLEFNEDLFIRLHQGKGPGSSSELKAIIVRAEFVKALGVRVPTTVEFVSDTERRAARYALKRSGLPLPNPILAGPHLIQQMIEKLACFDGRSVDARSGS